jgi:ABC-type amino acid transport substrate-binding protein
MAFFGKLRQLLKSRILLGIFALFLLLMLIRACMGPILLISGPYHIAYSINWSPIQLSGKEANLQAFMDELVTTIAEDERLPIRLATFLSGDLLNRLNDEEYDAILLTVSLSPYIKERYEISKPIFIAGPVLVVPASSSVTSLEQLKGKPIGIGKDSPLSFKLASQYPDLLLVTYDNTLNALNELGNQSIYGVIMEAQLAYTYIQVLFNGKLKVATPPLMDLGIRLITHKNERGKYLIEHFDAGLDKLKASGEYTKLLHKWALISANEQ